MKNNNGQNFNNQPLKLLRNITYPTYQLHAIARNEKKLPANKVLNIAILETLNWVRMRFRDLDIPSQLNSLQPSQYDEISLSDFKSFSIDNGYKVEVVWLIDESIWTLQLIEPDLGSETGTSGPTRQAVLGRMFETNIAYRIVGENLECGFRTIVSDIVRTTSDCEVFRLSLVKNLARNPFFGLRHGFDLVDETIYLDSVSGINHFKDWTKDKARMMPLILCVENSFEIPLTDASVNEIHASNFETINHLKESLTKKLSTNKSLDEVAAKINATNKPSEESLRKVKIGAGAQKIIAENINNNVKHVAINSGVLKNLSKKDEQATSYYKDANIFKKNISQSALDEEKISSLPAQNFSGSKPKINGINILQDIRTISRYKMGYAQIFALPMAFLEKFIRNLKHVPAPGDIIIYEPSAFGGEIIHYRFKTISQSPEEFFKNLDSYVQNYCKGKPMSFGSVEFLPKAKARYTEKIVNLGDSKIEIIKAYNENIKAIKERHNDEIRNFEIELESKNQKISRLKEEINDYETEISGIKTCYERLEHAYLIELERRAAEILRLKSILRRPTKMSDFVAWSDSFFRDKLIFHPRACEMIDNIPTNMIDIQSMCDAIEFLATDYRDELIGLITPDEMKIRCSNKYNRPYEVTPVSDATLREYSKEYKVKYGVGFTGKPVEKHLDLHMRIYDEKRIYFLYDKEKKLIVVGSLPKHLPTVIFRK